MLVGPTGGGKSWNMKVLSKALTKLENKGFYKVHIHNMNPKSITMGQLYGQFNEQTREWNDGYFNFYSLLSLFCILKIVFSPTQSEKHAEISLSRDTGLYLMGLLMQFGLRT